MSGTSSSLSSLSASANLPDPAGPALRGSRRAPAVGAGAAPGVGAVRLGAAGLRRKTAAGADVAPGWLPIACSRGCSSP